jgi:hypothetical protein
MQMSKMFLLTRCYNGVAGDEVAKYRLNAGKCLRLADAFSDPKSKRALLIMASAWLNLAERRLSRGGLTYETELTSPLI